MAESRDQVNNNNAATDCDDEDIDLANTEENNLKYLKPIQDADERREIRQNYRKLIEDLERDKHDLINPESDELNERLKQADEYYKPVKMTREAALDSQALVMIANMGRQKAQALNTEFVKFQPVEFVEKLKTFVCGNVLETGTISTEKWSTLGAAVQPFFKRSPPFRFMNGAFEKGEVDVRKERVKKVREKDSGVDKATVPIQVQRVQDTDKMEATTAEVERIYKILEKCYEKTKNNPLCYFEFVTNPHSFGQTIENIFYVSFLVRDGVLKISLDEDKLPVLEPIKESDKKTNKNVKNKQVIISLSPAEWKEVVKTFNITESVIPHRKAANEKRSKLKK
ncbi:hypothetical protein LOTGIDRAFT_235347 [Lottia gigantea]|uniref:Non-structural maintenance of chromosomes element 4 n=1 Tax=Lottia gigantea TaxID=225164 RepID=V3ZQD3_LOTGI|nr:hypothetical protein LOTGIDRAFT_235347 [Lottia gigantea]ESO86547.1 hypothetical protein LOTGIDRAFT_235347 [Lottia gigantea]